MATFKTIESVVPSQRSTVSAGIWSGGTGTLTTFFINTTQSGSSGNYYYDVYKDNPATDTTATAQFGITYGHFQGSGSFNTVDGNNPSKAIYRQLSNVLLSPGGNRRFKITKQGTITDFEGLYAIVLNRSRMREKMDPGNWELRLSGSFGTTAADNGIVKLIDDSNATTDPSVARTQTVFNVVSGSIATGTSNFAPGNAGQDPVGLFYPNHGIIVLSQTELKTRYDVSSVNPINFDAASANANDNNAFKLFTQVSASQYFVARREESVKSTHYFCRVNHDEFNYSSNPTYQTGSGDFVVPSFKQDPKAYITTVGLYNESNDLLAVAKLSQPILKSSAREAVIKVRLDF